MLQPDTRMFEELRELPAARRSTLKIILQVTTIAVFVLAIVYFMRKYSADISNLKALTAIDVLVIGCWSLGSYLAYAYAVYIVFIQLGLKGLGPWAWFRIYFVSRLVNFFVTQGGNLYRLLVLKKKYGFSYTNTVGVTGFLIWINAVIAVLAAVLLLSGMAEDYQVAGISLLVWCLLLLAALVGVPPLVLRLVRQGRKSRLSEFRMAKPFFQVAEFFNATLSNTRLLTAITALSVVHFCFFVGVNYFSFHAIDQQVGIGPVCVFTTALVFTRYINIVPGNLGVSELVGGLMSEQMGIGFSSGLIVSGIVRMVEVVMILVTGLIYGKFLALSSFKSR